MSGYYDTEEFVRKKVPGEIRVSKQVEPAIKLRYAAERLSDADSYEMAMEKDELILRESPSGTRDMRAKFFETSRGILALTLLRWNAKTDKPVGGGFTFVGSEIDELLSFVDSIRRVHFPGKGGLIIEPGALANPKFTDDDFRRVMRDKGDLIREFLKTDPTLGDAKAWGFRRESLKEFERLLTDDGYFEGKRLAAPNQSAERVWKDFFEADNDWIFGYGISYIFMTAVDPESLSRAVAGYSTAWKGHQPDATMKTRGAVSALSLVEIKTHQTPLVGNAPIRSAAYSASRELSEAISQCQSAVLGAENQLREQFQPKDKAGNPISQPVFNYRPNSTLVIGRLTDFQTENGVNSDKYGSFEMLRRNLVMPNIITFDELYERAKFIVEHSVGTS